jgi:serine/threonine-protein kinase
MQDNVSYKTYRELLAENEGRGFSEQKVTEVLQKVLPELVQMHKQGVTHGSISPDTLVQNLETLQTVLIQSQELNPCKQASTEGDVYDLGVVAIILLTGKSPEALQNVDGSWQWQDYRLVSDQLATILNKAISKKPKLAYSSAIQILNDLNGGVEATASPSVVITNSSTTTNSSFEVIRINSLSDLLIRRWQIVGVGALVLLSLLGVGLYSNRSQDPKSNSSTVTTDVSQSPNTTSIDPMTPSVGIAPSQSPQVVQPSYPPIPRENNLTKSTPPINSKSETIASSTEFPRSAQLIGQTSGSRVNVRSAPSTRSYSPHYGLVGDRITALKQGKGDDGKTWYFVKFSSGATGWVRGDFIELQ